MIENNLKIDTSKKFEVSVIVTRNIRGYERSSIKLEISNDWKSYICSRARVYRKSIYVEVDDRDVTSFKFPLSFRGRVSAGGS